jgi:flagellar biosynthesis protein FlhA
VTKIKSASPKKVGQTSKSKAVQSPIVLALGEMSFELTSAENRHFYLSLLNALSHFSRELGVPLPELELACDLTLPEFGFRLTILGQVRGEGAIRLGRWLAIGDPEVLSTLLGEPTVDPIYGLPARWIATNLAQSAQSKGALVLDSETILSTMMMQRLTPHLGALLQLDALHVSLEYLSRTQPQLVETARQQVGIAQILWICRELLNEGVSIRALDHILTGALEAQPKHKASRLEHARRRLGPMLAERYLDCEGFLGCIQLARWVERHFKQQLKLESGCDDWFFKLFCQDLEAAIAQSWELGLQPVLIVDSVIRRDLWQMLNRLYSDLVVLSWVEIDSFPVIPIYLIGEKIHPMVQSWPRQVYQAQGKRSQT